MTVLLKGLRWVLRVFLRRYGARRPLLLALMLSVTVSVAFGVARQLLALDVRLALPLAIAGLLFAWLLATTAVSERRAIVVLLVLGFLLTLVLVGGLADELLAVPLAAFALLASIYHSIWQWVWSQRGLESLPEVVSNWERLVLAARTLSADTGVLFSRVFAWASAHIRGEPFPDPIAVAFVWGLVLWVVTAWAVWCVRRRERVLLGIAPAGALLALAFFSGGDSSGLAVLPVLLALALLCMALVAYDVRVRRLEAAGKDVAYGVSTDVATASILLTVVLVGAAVLVPSISMQDIFDRMARFASGQVGGGVGGDEQGEPPARPRQPLTTLDEMRVGGLPRNHLLTTPPEELSRQVVMVIQTGDLDPVLAPEVEEVNAPRYYWRSATYDRYTQYGWITSGTWTEEYTAGDALGLTALETQRVVRQNVRFVSNLGGVVHASGELLAVNADYTVDWRSTEDAFGATLAAVEYTADSLLASPSADDLRTAGTDYPDWVVERYLQLPDTVTSRTRALARDLTATERVPYERALAIQAYLRSYTYTLDVPFPPADRDLVDYFLFDLQKGYCGYYASAMVVLARAAGLPARMVIGYAPGAYDAMEARYVITEADAHAWAEVYFPGYGWVEFEPTAGRPAIDRSAMGGELEWPSPEQELVPPEAEPVPLRERLGAGRWALLASIGLGLPVLLGTIWLGFDAYRLRRMRPAAAVVAVYGRLERHGRRLAAPPRAGDTPYEYARSFSARLADMARDTWLQNVLAPAAKEICRLTDVYVQVSYGPRPPDPADRLSVARLWQRLRWRLWLARLWVRLPGGKPRLRVQ